MSATQRTNLDRLEAEFRLHWNGCLERIHKDICEMLMTAEMDLEMSPEERSMVHARIVAGIGDVLSGDCGSVRELDLECLPQFALGRIRARRKASPAPNS